VELQISSALPTNPVTQIYIAQNVFTSNIVTIPVVASAPPAAAARPASQQRRENLLHR
jgi:hypothetical protein